MFVKRKKNKKEKGKKGNKKYRKMVPNESDKQKVKQKKNEMGKTNHNVEETVYKSKK